MSIGPSRGRSGVTLVEIVMSLSLSSLVLAGLMSVMAGALRSHINLQAKGEVSAWALLALKRINQDLGNASYIQLPRSAGSSGDELAGCANFSRLLYDGLGGQADGRLDAGAASAGDVMAFRYCRDDDIGGGAGHAVPGLVRYERKGAGLVCPDDIPAPAACGEAVEGSDIAVLARNLRPRQGGSDEAAPGLFSRTRDGIELNFTVGMDAASAAGRPAFAVPVALGIRTFARIQGAMLEAD